MTTTPDTTDTTETNKTPDLVALSGLSPEEILAIAKHFKDDSDLVKQARERVAPGKHTIRAAVQLAGILKVNNNYFMTPTPRLSGLQCLLVVTLGLMDECAMSKSQALAFVARVIELVLTLPLSEEELKKNAENTDDALAKELIRTKEQIQARIGKALAKVEAKGACSFNGLAEPTGVGKGFAKTMGGD